MQEPWAVVIAALGSAFFTITGSFWLENYRLKRVDQAVKKNSLREACIQMGGNACALTLRAQTLYTTATMRSGIKEGIDVVLRFRKPLDPMEFNDWLFKDVNRMFEAQSLIEVSGNYDLIRSASELMIAAAALIGKASSATRSTRKDDKSLPTKKILAFLRPLLPIHRDPDIEREIEEAIRELAKQLRQFTALTRKHLKVNDPDAIVRAFPELFQATGASARVDDSLPSSPDRHS